MGHLPEEPPPALEVEPTLAPPHPLATNQGLLYVLSMVVIGAMVGAGGLGFDIVYGFRQSSYAGRGLAAGITIVLLGIMLDRITQAVARRSEARTHHAPAH